MIDLAVSLTRTREFFPVFLFPRHYPNVRRHSEESAAKSVASKVAFKPTLATPEEELDGLWRGVNFILRVTKRLIRAIPGMSYCFNLVSLMAKMFFIRRLLVELSPSVIILGGDIVGHDMALYIKVSRSLNIRSLILPGWMASAREPAELQLYNPEFSLSRPLNWLFSCFFPQWCFHHKGRDLIRLPAQEALALETLGLAPPLPWILHSGYADMIAVESEAAQEYGIREGLEPQRLVVVGSHTHDVLRSKLIARYESRKVLCKNLGLDPSRPIVVCALPPDMLYGKGGRPECEFPNYSELVAGFLGPIQKQLRAPFIVCPHPSAHAEEMQFVKEHGAIIVSDAVAELIPLADIYVASISATIQWAIACSIPVINYDVYRYHYTDYTNLSGVISIESNAKYKDTLLCLIENPIFRSARATDQQNVASHWGNLDGHAVERITELLRGLAVS